jgi:hypothetical protein
MALPAFKLLAEKIIAIAAATIPKKNHIITPPQGVTKNAYGLIIVQIQNLGNFFVINIKIGTGCFYADFFIYYFSKYLKNFSKSKFETVS